MATQVPGAFRPTVDDEADVRQPLLGQREQPQSFGAQLASGVSSTALFGFYGMIIIIGIVAFLLLLLFIVLVNISFVVFTTFLYQLTGHAILRGLGVKIYQEVSLGFAMKAGAVGGAIVAVPWGFISSFLDALVAGSDEERTATAAAVVDGATAIPSNGDAVDIGPETTLSENAAGTAKRLFKAIPSSKTPFHPNIRTRSLEEGGGLHVLKTFVQFIVDLIHWPLLGAVAGAVGSAVLKDEGTDPKHGAYAGALGALVITTTVRLIVVFFALLFLNYITTKLAVQAEALQQEEEQRARNQVQSAAQQV